MSCDECNKCNRCGERECACPKPILEIRRKDSDSLVLVFNDNGVTTEYDFDDLIKDGQTDTSLSVDVMRRIIKFAAEKHIDSLSAEELGSILHLSDIGDVSTKGVANGSSLVYHKESGCPSGCVGTSNQWRAWNALDNIVGSADYLSAYNSDGFPQALGRPANADQYYLLQWKAGEKIGWGQPRVATVKGPEDYTVYMDKNTKEIYVA